MCADNINTKICRKVNAPVKYETSSCINSMQSISYININDRFTVIGWYKYGAINGRSVIPENSNGNKKIVTEKNLKFKLTKDKFTSALVPFN